MNVNQIMSGEVKTCSMTASLEEAARLMWDNDCGAIPVVNEQGRPVGIVTDRDVAMAAVLNHKPLWDLSVSTVTQGQRLCTCGQSDPVSSCLQKMEQNGVRRLPVINADGRLAGILSMGDIVAFAGNGKAAPKSGRAAKAGADVPLPQLMSMLQQVSGHHMAPSRPVAVA